MAVVVLKTELKCKLCKHPRRADIDALLEKRSRGEKDAEGNRVNADYVIARLREFGVQNPSIDNIRAHLGQRGNNAHTGFVTEAEEEAAKAEADELLQKLAAGEIEHVDPDEIIRFQLTRYYLREVQKAANGDPSDLTHDQARALIGEATKRKQNDAQNALLGALAGGIGKAVAGMLVKSSGPAELEPATIEGEAVEVEDGELAA